MSVQRAVCAVACAAVILAVPHRLAAQQFTTQKFSIGGTGGTDYLAADPATGRVYVSRGTHVMVVDGMTGSVVGDIPDTPRVHGIAFAPKEGHGFTTNAGDSTLTMFNLSDMAVIRKVHIGIDGADGIMFDEATNTIVSINHSHPMGTAVGVNAKTGEVTGTITLSGAAPEGGAPDGHGKVFINIEDKNAIDVVDLRTMKVVTTWKIDPCDEPTGIAFDRRANRIFSGCSKKSVVVDASSGKVVATIDNGDGVDALGWDATEKLIFVPAGRSGNITVVHQDAADRYTVTATVPTVPGAKTITVDESRHRAYVFAVEYGPAPVPAAGTPPPAPGSRPPRGPIVGTWFVSVTH
jgi:WD40 repeat protein